MYVCMPACMWVHVCVCGIVSSYMLVSMWRLPHVASGASSKKSAVVMKLGVAVCCLRLHSQGNADCVKWWKYYEQGRLCVPCLPVIEKDCCQWRLQMGISSTCIRVKTLKPIMLVSVLLLVDEYIVCSWRRANILQCITKSIKLPHWCLQSYSSSVRKLELFDTFVASKNGCPNCT